MSINIIFIPKPVIIVLLFVCLFVCLLLLLYCVYVCVEFGVLSLIPSEVLELLMTKSTTCVFIVNYVYE